jgi:di/tricarboxylate transporter
VRDDQQQKGRLLSVTDATMKSRHTQSKPLQWTVALLFLAALVALVLIVTLSVARLFGLSCEHPAHLGLAMAAHIVLFLPLWLLLSLFLLAPLFRLTGVLRYYSPYLIASRAQRGRIYLHGATPFDYLLLFRWRDRGRPAVQCILLWYVDGLLALARELERGRLPLDTTISATSYIFSAGSARRYGFTVEEAPRFSIGGYLTYPTQLLTYSFAQGRWALPPIHRARQATIDGATLRAQVSRLERLQTRLRKAQAQRGDLR